MKWTRYAALLLFVGMALGIMGLNIGLVTGSVPAFPGASGSGASTVGGSGRNGTGTPVVMEVTTLADNTGSGTLRSCIIATGPRTCIFKVSGFIVALTRLQISHPYLTIAGQTSPKGIMLQSAGTSNCASGSTGCGAPFISTHDVVIRYVSYDGSANTPTGPDTGTVGFEFASGDVFNVVVDHVSCRWWGNACFDITSNDAGNTHEISVQWSLFYEPNEKHPIIVKLDATSGSALHTANTDFHHNVGINYDHRWPMSSIRSFRWVSNLSYNHTQDGDSAYLSYTWGGAQPDYISNLYLDGPDSESHVHAIIANHDNGGSDASDNCIGSNPCDNPGPPSIYLLNNISHVCAAGGTNNCQLRTLTAATHTVNDQTQINQTAQGSESGEEAVGGITRGPMPGGWFRSTPLPSPTYPIPQDAAETLLTVLPPTVGNSQGLACTGGSVSRRDSADQRVLNQLQAKGGGAMYTGQYTSPSISNPAPCTTTLHDGMPDAYKSANSLSLTDGTLWKTVQANGYTALENYLNQIGQANGSGSGTGTSGGGGGTSNPPPGGTDPTPIPDVVISNVNVSGITTSCATINWTTNNAADSQVGYGVCPTSLTHTPCCAPANVTNHSIQVCGLVPSTQYSYVAQSFDGNTTAVSPIATFTTAASTTTQNPTQPTAPVLNPAIPITSFELTWPPSVSTGVTSYKVYRSNQSGRGYIQIAQLTGTTFVDTSVQTGQTWFYVITAIAPQDTVTESAFSNEVKVVIP